MSSNSGCVTGILIDISNVDDKEPFKRTPDSSFPLQKHKSRSLDDEFDDFQSYEMTKTFRFPRSDNGISRDRIIGGRLPMSADANIDNCELIENEVFDFDCCVKSPNSSFSSDYDFNTGFLPKNNEDTTNWSPSEEMSLNTEELAEVFREATVVAVKLENYVLGQNRTPVKSPNHMKLFLERSAQKKLKELCPKDDDDGVVCVEPQEPICRSHEIVEKKEEVQLKLTSQLATAKVATPALKMAVKSVGAFKNTAPSLTSFRPKVPSSSVGVVSRSGPLRAIPMTSKQTKTLTFQSSSAATKSVIGSRLRESLNKPVVQTRTSLARSNSSVQEAPTRPLLYRRNSFNSSVTTTPKASTSKTVVMLKPQSRRSFGGVSACPTPVGTTSESKRRSLLAVSSPTASCSARGVRNVATPLYNKKNASDGSQKASPLYSSRKFV